MLAKSIDMPPGVHAPRHGRSDPPQARSSASSTQPDEMVGLVERAKSGDRAAVGALIRLIAPDVLSAARRVMGVRGRADADDVAQESLIALSRALPSIQEPMAVSGYAIRITVRNAMRARRRLARTVDMDFAPEPGSGQGEGDPESNAVALRRAEALSVLLDELPSDQAEALFLRIALGQDLATVAQTADAPINTIRSRVRLGMAAVRRKLAKRPHLRRLLEPES
ncbi:MAG: RNA polymerase sigma factor [Myxococcota bacterium]